jgi:hypothetical protein
MSRKPLKPTPLAIALQAASQLLSRPVVFAILISDGTRHRAGMARAGAPPLHAYDSHANSR